MRSRGEAGWPPWAGKHVGAAEHRVMSARRFRMPADQCYIVRQTSLGKELM
jgi:hypothetical protein